MVSKFLSILLPLLIFTSCEFNKSNSTDNEPENDFYSASADGDIIRIPVLEPYEIFSSNNGATWFFKVPFGDIHRVIGVTPSEGYLDGEVLLIYCDHINLPGKSSAEAWLSYDLKNEKVECFTEKNEFLKKYKNGTKLRNLDEVYAGFVKKGVVEW